MNRCFRLAVLILIGAEEIAPVTGIASTMDTTMSTETDTLKFWPQLAESVNDQLRALARLIVGPRLPVPAGSRFSLDELRDVRWTSHATSQEKREALSLARDILAAGYSPPPSQPAGSEAVKKLKPQYPDYIDDRDGLDWFRREVKRNDGHDMAAVNFNSLGRLIDTIDRLAAALSATAPADGGVTDAGIREGLTRAARMARSWSRDPGDIVLLSVTSAFAHFADCLENEDAVATSHIDTMFGPPSKATPSQVQSAVGGRDDPYNRGYEAGKRVGYAQALEAARLRTASPGPSEVKSSLLAGGEAGSGGGVAAPSIPGPAACDPADVRRSGLQPDLAELDAIVQEGVERCSVAIRRLIDNPAPTQPEAQAGSDTSRPSEDIFNLAQAEFNSAQCWNRSQPERMRAALEVVWPTARLAAADAMAEALTGIWTDEAVESLAAYHAACATGQQPDAEAGTREGGAPS